MRTPFFQSEPKARSSRRRVLRAVAILFPILLPTSMWAGCGQVEVASSLSDTARSVLALNQSLSAGVGGLSVHAALSGSTHDLLAVRAQLLRQLMQQHPEELRLVMLPVATATALLTADAGMARMLEHDAMVSGDLAVIAADDFEHGTAESLLVLHDRATAQQIALHPVGSVPAKSLLHQVVTITGVQLGTEIAVETMSVSAVPQPSGNVGTAMRSTGGMAQVASSDGTGLACLATGQQRTAVLLLQFPNNTPAFPGSYGTPGWWQQAIAGTSDSVNAIWAEASGGSTYATVDVYGPLTLGQTYGCQDFLAMRSAALNLAGSTIDLSRYNRIVLGFPASSCTYGGLADVGCNGADNLVPHPYSVVWMPIVSSYTASTGVWGSLTHEMGHNLGLNHANTLDFGTISLGPMDFQATNPGTVNGTGATTAAGAVTAVNTEYGDRFSVMGNPWVGGPGPYSAEHRTRLLGWLPASGSGSGLGTAIASGTYTLQPSLGGSGLRSLRALRDADSASWLWLEYRSGSSTYDGMNLHAVQGQNLTSGALVHYEDGYGDHSKTFQLDMTPVSTGNNFADGALSAGRSWSDPYSPLTLTVNSVSAAGLNVSVSYDTTCAAFSVGSDPVPVAGGSGTVVITAPAGCAWTASTNAPWLTLGGTIQGNGSGSFSWAAAPNTGTGQRVTYLSAGRVSHRLLQLGAGANVVSLLPESGSVIAGSAIPLTLNLQDLNGLGDLQLVQFNAMGAGVAPCDVLVSFQAGAPVFYLLDDTTRAYTSGMAAGDPGAIVTTGCTLAGTGSGIAVHGSSVALTLNLTFPASAPGERGLFATVNAATELPLGLLHVASGAALVSTTTLTATPLAAVPGTTTTLAVAVTAGAGSTVPTGNVTLQDGGGTLAVLTLDGSGQASFATAALGNGTHTLTAVYAGDAAFAGSTSAPVAVTIAPQAAQAVLSASATDVAAVGGSVVLTASIDPAQGTQLPSGTLTLRDGATTVMTATLNHAAASFAVSSLTGGNHNFTAVYSGDTEYLPTTTNLVTVMVGRPAATLAVAAAPVVLAGAPLTLSVTATTTGAGGQGATVPAGVILLQEDGQALASMNLTNATASVTLGPLPDGEHTFLASYSGNGNFTANAPATATVNTVDFTLAGPASGGGIHVKAGATAGNTANFTLEPGATGFPLAVSLTCDGAPAHASCAVTPGTLTPGSATVTATVTVTTSAASATSPGMAAWIGLPMLGWVTYRGRRRGGLHLLKLALFALSLCCGLAGCGTGIRGGAATWVPSDGGTPAGDFVLTVHAVATSGGATLVRVATVPLQVR